LIIKVGRIVVYGHFLNKNALVLYSPHMNKKLSAKTHHRSERIGNDSPGNILNEQKLQKTYKDAADAAVQLSAISLIFLTGFAFFSSDMELGLLRLVVVFLILLPIVYYARQLKHKGIAHLTYARNVSLFLFFYTFIVITVNVLAGGVGILWLIVLYYFFQSYRKTKQMLNEKI
jgi:hypothetical protein